MKKIIIGGVVALSLVALPHQASAFSIVDLIKSLFQSLTPAQRQELQRDLQQQPPQAVNNAQPVNPNEPRVAEGSNCFTVTSLKQNSRVSFPLTIRGNINNSQDAGCSWGMFEGTAGSAQLYYNYNNEGWRQIGQNSSITVANWTSDKTTFSTTLNFNNDGIGIPPGTPLKVVFGDENAKDGESRRTYEFPLVLALSSSASPTPSSTLMPLKVISPKAGDVWVQDNAYVIKFTPIAGDFDNYSIRLANRLVPGVEGGGPVFQSISKDKGGNPMEVTFDPRDLSQNLIQSWLTNARNTGHGDVSEEALRRNFYIHIVALKDRGNSKDSVVADGTSGVFSIINGKGSGSTSGGSTTSGGCAVSSYLGVGSTGGQVEAIQKFLINNGFAIADGVTGTFGDGTKQALIKYQASVGLPSTGFAGPLTIARICGSSQTGGSVTLSAAVKTSTIDKAGAWNNFGPGAGNVNQNPADWNWQLSITNNGNDYKTIKRITIKSSVPGEVWSTGFSRYLSDGTDLYGYDEHPYPLVTELEKGVLNTKYDQAFNFSVYPHSGSTLILYGQKENSQFTGGKIFVEFTDGTMATGVVVGCPAGYTCSEPALPDYSIPTPTPTPTPTSTNHPGDTKYPDNMFPTIKSLGTTNALPGEKVAIYASNLTSVYTYYLYMNAGTNSTTVSVTRSENGYLGFTVPQIPAGKYRINLRAYSGSVPIGNGPEVDFTVNGAAASYPDTTSSNARFTAPNGGETYIQGNTYSAKTLGGVDGDRVKIEFVSVSTGQATLVRSDMPLTASYESSVLFEVPRTLSVGSYFFRMTRVADGRVLHSSPTVSVVAPEPGIGVSRPMINDSYFAGGALTVAYSASNFPAGTTFEIKLAKRELVVGSIIQPLQTIVTGLQSTNSTYTWKIPTSVSPANNYLIQVCPSSYVDKCGQSLTFTIKPPATPSPSASASSATSFRAPKGSIANVFYAVGDVFDNAF